MKKYVLSLSFVAMSCSMMAQSGTNSPYSMYGLGKMSEQSQGFNRGMNGVGIAFREHNQVNYINPASYSAIDSLTFIFDVGMTLQNTNFKEGNKSKNAKNADFEYAVGSFRVAKGVGMAFGIVPYSNVGYDYKYKTSVIDNYIQAPAVSSETTNTMSYSGNGGIHQLFLGAGWSPMKGLSIGANFNYLWGTINNYTTSSYSDNYVKSLAKQFTASVHNYKLDFGAQYSHAIGKKGVGTIGVTYSPGHNLASDPECLLITSNSQSSVNDTTVATAVDGLSIPTQLGIGLSYAYSNRWKVGVDYSLQKWSSVKECSYLDASGKSIATTGSYNDRHSIKIGGEYCQNELSRDASKRIRYRAGLGYSSPYLKINGVDGPREISLSAGVGIPIVNTWNNRSVLNVSLQWQNLVAKNMITENALILNIGITFNERWFAKWKFE